jgi:hypothetical protein
MRSPPGAEAPPPEAQFREAADVSARGVGHRTACVCVPLVADAGVEPADDGAVPVNPTAALIRASDYDAVR